MELYLAKGKYTSIRRDIYNYVTNLLFADDMLVFSKANNASLRDKKKMPEKMENYIGLSVNSSKSTVFF